MSEILGDFGTIASPSGSRVRDGVPVTIWIPVEAKARYDRIQEKTGRQLSKKAREMLLALIEIAEAKTAA